MLAHFRNYHRLGLDLQPGVVLLRGENGQGKSNLLEAIHVLATTRSPRTGNERELVTWRDPNDELARAIPPFARLEGRVRRAAGDVHLEVLFRGDVLPAAAEEPAPREVTGPLTRSILVNGLPTRAPALVGQLAVVYFSPQDVAIADGPPSGRRQYLNIANSQVAPAYLRALQQYNRVLAQRNHLLRLIRERRQPPSALAPWSEQLFRTGALVLDQRLRMLAALNRRLPSIFRDLSGTQQELRLVYRSGVFPSGPLPTSDVVPSMDALIQAFRERQADLAGREVEQAVSLLGPHRDDFALLLHDVDLTSYGSRGQQRLAVLALKLAEAEWMSAEMDERPVLLLDDVLSELDPRKRGYVLDCVAATLDSTTSSDQVWITTTETDGYPSSLVERAQVYCVDAGTVRRA